MDVFSDLAFDDGGIVIGDAQLHRNAQLLGQVLDEGLVTLLDAGGVLVWDGGEDELGIIGLPVGVGGSGKHGKGGEAGGGLQDVTAVHHG